MKRSNPDFLNGVPELLALSMLARQPMHGYQLVEAIRAATGAALEFGEGSIYPVLHRLEAAGCLAAEREAAGGRTRIVYRLAPKGRERLHGATSEWARVVAAVQAALGGSHGRPALS